MLCAHSYRGYPCAAGENAPAAPAEDIDGADTIVTMLADADAVADALEAKD